MAFQRRCNFKRHGITDGQQIFLTGGTFQITHLLQAIAIVYTVRNTTTNTFELFDSDGTTAINVTSFSSAPTLEHTTIVVANVEGTFSAGEVVTGQTSNAALTLQSDVLGFKGVKAQEILHAVKQIGMAGSPTYTADTSLTSSHGTNKQLQVMLLLQIQVTYFGKGTNFTNDIKIGDSVSFTNDGSTHN